MNLEEFEREKLFQQELENSILKKLKLKINNNRSTMLSVRWEPDTTFVSLHRMFLQAPGHVVKSLAGYINRRVRKLSPEVKSFIETGVQNLDYSETIAPETLVTKGEHYDLLEIFHEINQSYFNGTLENKITWYGRRHTKNRTKFTLGYYHETLKLIKIHRALDAEDVPRFLVKFILYHEILHSICKPYVDERGVRRIHTKEFIEREKQFCEYALVQDWMQENSTRFFVKHYS